jgi:hypothetical protein
VTWVHLVYGAVCIAAGFIGAMTLRIARVGALHDRHQALRYLAQNLLDHLPECDNCTRVATHAFRRGEGRWCAGHCPNECPAYPRAEPVRQLEMALEREFHVDA